MSERTYEQRLASFNARRDRWKTIQRFKKLARQKAARDAVHDEPPLPIEAEEVFQLMDEFAEMVDVVNRDISDSLLELREAVTDFMEREMSDG